MEAQKINSTFSDPRYLTAVGDKLYFRASDETGTKLWSIKASSANTPPTFSAIVAELLMALSQDP